MEIQVGMLRADMVKDARDRPPDAGIETSTELTWIVSRTYSRLECFTVSCLAKLSPMAMNALASSLIKWAWVSICVSIARSAAQ
jgi:hypothetical protein